MLCLKFLHFFESIAKGLDDAILAQSATTENEAMKNQAAKVHSSLLFLGGTNCTLQTTLGNTGKRKRQNVYSFGEAQYSKLGHDKMSMAKAPKLVHALLDKDVIDISFGAKHALALTGHTTSSYLI